MNIQENIDPLAIACQRKSFFDGRNNKKETNRFFWENCLTQSIFASSRNLSLTSKEMRSKNARKNVFNLAMRIFKREQLCCRASTSLYFLPWYFSSSLILLFFLDISFLPWYFSAIPQFQYNMFKFNLANRYLLNCKLIKIGSRF